MKPLSLVSKTLVSASFFSLLCYSGLSHAAVSQQPLMLVESVAPNLLFTLDDSGSMEFAYAPDGLSDSGFKVNGIEICPNVTNGCRNTRRAKSSDFNPLYYNPDMDYIIPKKADGSSYTTSFTSAPWNGFTGSDSRNLSTNYRPVWNNDWSGGTRYANHPSQDFNNTTSGTHAYYYVYNESRPGCLGQKHDDDCYEKKKPSTTAEKTNFAIWYSFYRTRGLATVSAAHLAFYELPSSVRLSWQRINGNSSQLSNNFAVYNQGHKDTFFTWLKDNSKFNGATPLLRAMTRAGSFLSTNAAWNNTIGSTSSGRYECRPAYHILMADGIWNGDKPSQPDPYLHDNTSWSAPDGKSYSPKAPYKHSDSHTLADLAMHYWATDLRPGIENRVKPYIRFSNSDADTQYWDARNNPATWQHMVNFTVGLGLSGSLVEPDLLWEEDKGTFGSSGYANLLSGTDWPKVGGNAEATNGKVYDLWHAAINSRGEFFSADSPESLVQSFSDIINRIAERTATAAAAGAAPSTIDNDPDEASNFTVTTNAYFPEYNSEEWSGDLKQVTISRDQSGHITRTPGWSAQAMIDAQSSRNIYMGGGARGTGLRSFSHSNLSNDLQAIFDRNPDSLGNNTDGLGTQRVAYLRGNRGNEGDADDQFRRRSSVLGDIVNSQPAVVGTPTYLPYLADRIDGSRGDYLAFQQQYSTSGPNADRQELIYVGANDGMLHAISAADGTEAFAFIPEAVLQHMPKLTGQKYKGGGHRFYVDGSPVVRDVYFNDQWRTVLVGTLRAGGKSLFALDITEPGADGSGVKLLWEITSDTDDFKNLGYSFPEPEITRLHSGEWAVLQGNGYDSADGVASLFIIDIADGSLIKEIIAETGEDGANGLSSIRGADNNADGIVDYAYAGDLQGNLWRFDLAETSNRTIVGDPFGPSNQSGVTAADYKVSYGGQPLYKARYSDGQVQPITSPPSLVRHPSRYGYLVLFGTGKYFETDDAAPDTTKAHSVYAVWDRLTKAQSGSHPAGLTRRNLQEQEISQQKLTTFTNEGTSITRDLRYITNNDVTWYQTGVTPAQEANNNSVQTWGWFVDLEVNSKEGEMMIQRMSAQGDSLLFNTLTPNADPCADGATYWAYAVNPYTGGRTRHPTFDFNQDGRFDLKDTDGGTVPSGYSTASPGTPGGGSLIDITGATHFSRAARTSGRLTWQSMPLEVDE